jgi:ketosteroid isomerase-like protein
MSEASGTRLASARAFVAALISGDVEASLAAMSEHVEYRVQGHNAFAGVFRGREQVREHVAALLHETSSDFEKVEDWLTSDQRVAAIVRHRLEYAGRSAVGRRVLLFEFDVHDRITVFSTFTEAQEHFDAMVGSRRPAEQEATAPAPPPAPPTVSGALPPERQKPH